MAFLFTETIHNWQSWGAVFQNKTAFLPLVQYICKKEGLKIPQTLGSLTPGTNAVFQVGEYVIKIYAPAESGIGTAKEIAENVVFEYNAQLYAAGKGVDVPEVVAVGVVRDKYDFHYMMQRFIKGAAIKSAWPNMHAAEKQLFAMGLKELTASLQHPTNAKIKQVDLLQQTLENARWQALPSVLVQELHAYAKTVLDSNPTYVFCHGDLTEDNVLLGDKDSIALLDFGDALLAPACYELPSIAFELFREDREAMHAYIGTQDKNSFLEDLIAGLSIHDFGGDILLQFFARNAIDGAKVDSIAKLKRTLRTILFA